MAVFRLTASWIVRLWLGMLAWLGATVTPRTTVPVPLVPSVALVPARSVALVCLPRQATALVRCPLAAMALVRYVPPTIRTYRAAPVHLTAFGLRTRHVAARLAVKV